jgi:hypothetical protein
MKSKQKEVRGFYNALKYSIEIDGEIVYTAGNGRGDSQAYVSAANGVGLEKMHEYCEQTANEFAEETEGGIFVGITKNLP